MKTCGCLVLTLAFAVAISATTAGQQIHVGPNVQVSPWDSQHTYDEVRIAADPNDSRYLIGCAMPQHNGVAAFASDDGGVHWKQTLVLPNGSDPECEFGNHGDAYLVTFYSGESLDKMKLYIFWSGDHGQTWRQRNTLPAGDRPSIAVDRTDQKGRDTLYILQTSAIDLEDDAGKQHDPMRSQVYASDDSGKTFKESSSLYYEHKLNTAPYYLFRSHPAILTDGTAVYISPIDCRGNNFNGDCYRKPAMLAYANHPGSSVGFRLLSEADVSSEYDPELAVANGGPFKDWLFGVYCAPLDAQGNQAAYLITSSDHGRSWSKSLQVAPAHGPCLMPMVAANKEGIVGISWYAGKSSRHFTADHAELLSDSPYAYSHDWDKRLDVRCDVDERFTASLDGGKSVLPSVIVNPIADPKPIQFVPSILFDDRFEAQDPEAGFQLVIEYSTTGNGDTQGLTVSADGTFHPAWVDFRTGVGMVYTAGVEVNPTASPSEPAANVAAGPDLCRPPNESTKQSSIQVPAPKSIPPNDVTVAYDAHMLNSTYDKEHNIYTADIQLEGPANQLARGVYLELTHGRWPTGTKFLNADNQLQGEGARWQFVAGAQAGSADVRVKSEVRQIRLYMPALHLNSDSLGAFLRVRSPQS
jgi:hypothetical protein